MTTDSMVVFGMAFLGKYMNEKNKKIVSFGSRFGRKESTSATGDLYSILITRFDTVPA